MGNIIKPLQILEVNNHPQILTSLIDQQWKDIHHSRKQDWMYWAILAAIVAGILTLFSKDRCFSDDSFPYLILNILLAFGIIISSWAAAISWSHWILHIKRLGYICWLERFYYIKIKNKHVPLSLPPYKAFGKKDKFVVNGLIFSMYMSIGLIFISLLICSELISFKIIVLSSVLEQQFVFIIPLFLLVAGSILIFTIHTFTRKKMDNLKDQYLTWLGHMMKNHKTEENNVEGSTE